MYQTSKVSLYCLAGWRRLQINADLFRQSVNAIDRSASTAVKQTERAVKLPEQAAKSALMRTLEDIVSPLTSDEFQF